jgi:starch phosphorylase
MYDTLENKIMPMYYRKNEEGYSPEWMQVMKNSIASNSGVYSTARMLQDYTNQLYVPLMDLKPTYSVLENIVNYNEWRFNLHEHFDEIEIKQSEENFNNMTVDAGNQMEVGCEVKIPVTIDVNSVTPQVFYGKISEKGIVDDIKIVDMNLVGQEGDVYKYKAKIDLKTGGDYGYTFRVVPHNDMILDPMTLNEIKWITEEAE